MDGDQHLWRVWVEVIQRWGIEKWLASFIESFGSLFILGAQLLYFSGPIINRNFPEEHLTAIARMMENPDLSRAFAELLKESSSQ